MATPVQDIEDRMVEVLTGVYPASPASPYIPAGVFAQSPVFLPDQNPRHPGGPSRASVDRKFDIVWRAATWDANGIEGSAGGPWVRRLAFTLQIQYELKFPNTLAPSAKRLVLGGLTLASNRALSDLLEIQRVFMLDAMWSGVGMAYVPDQSSIVVEPFTAVSIVGRLRGEILVEQLAMTAESLWA